MPGRASWTVGRDHSSQPTRNHPGSVANDTLCCSVFDIAPLTGSIQCIVQTLVFEILGLLHNFMTDIFAQLFLNVCLRDWGVIAREWLA